VNRTVRTLAIVAAALSAVPAAWAEEPAPTQGELDAAKAAFVEGNALYKAGKLLEAIEKIKESYRLSRNPMLLYNLGFIFDQAGQTEMVLTYYRKFLADAPPSAPKRDDVAKRVAALEKEQAAAPPPEVVVPTAPTSKYSQADFKHKTVDTTPPDKPVEITAVVPEDSGFTVTLFYRGGGDETFASEPMTRRGEVLVGHIPATEVTGNWVQYYLEVRDPDRKLITRSGKSTSPNLVFIEAPKAVNTVITVAPLEDPLLDRPPALSDRPREPLRPAKWIASGAAVALLGGAVFLYTRAQKQHDLLVLDATSCGTPPCREFDAAYGHDVEARGVLYDRLYKVSLGLGVGAVALSGYLWYRELHATKPGEVRLAISPAVGRGFTGAAFAARF